MAAEASPKDGLRWHHCAGPLSKEIGNERLELAAPIRNSFSMIGSAVGGTASAFDGFNHVMPVVRRWVKGPMWLHFLIGVSVATLFFAFSNLTAFFFYK